MQISFICIFLFLRDAFEMKIDFNHSLEKDLRTFHFEEGSANLLTNAARRDMLTSETEIDHGGGHP
jgi:hypothetical protein